MWTRRAGTLCKGTAISEQFWAHNQWFQWKRGVNTWAYLTDVLANCHLSGGIIDSRSRPGLDSVEPVTAALEQTLSDFLTLFGRKIYVSCGEKKVETFGKTKWMKETIFLVYFLSHSVVSSSVAESFKRTWTSSSEFISEVKNKPVHVINLTEHLSLLKQRFASCCVCLRSFLHTQLQISTDLKTLSVIYTAK